MANDFYTASGNPSTGAQAASATMRAEFALIVAAFDKHPTLTANGSKIIAVNSGATALEAITTTGTGSGVRATSPTLTTPILGTPTSGTLTNCTEFPTASLTGLGTGVATFLATPSSANLRSALTDETGTGAAVFATSPAFGGWTSTAGVVVSGGSSSATKGVQTYFDTGGNIGWLLSFEQGVNWYKMHYDGTLHGFHTGGVERVRVTEGQILAQDGSAAAPTYSFLSSGSDDCGMYLSGTNEISWAVAGTKKLTLATTGVQFDGGSSNFGVVNGTEVGVSNIGSGIAAYVKEGYLSIHDGMSAPAVVVGKAHIYVDTADGDLKVKFGDGTVKTISVDT